MAHSCLPFCFANEKKPQNPFEYPSPTPSLSPPAYSFPPGGNVLFPVDQGSD